MIWIQFLATALVIVVAGVPLARYGDVLGEKTGLGRSWIGVVLVAATTSLPELFTGFGATALAALISPCSSRRSRLAAAGTR